MTCWGAGAAPAGGFGAAEVVDPGLVGVGAGAGAAGCSVVVAVSPVVSVGAPGVEVCAGRAGRGAGEVGRDAGFVRGAEVGIPLLAALCDDAGVTVFDTGVGEATAEDETAGLTAAAVDADPEPGNGVAADSKAAEEGADPADDSASNADDSDDEISDGEGDADPALSQPASVRASPIAAAAIIRWCHTRVLLFIFTSSVDVFRGARSRIVLKMGRLLR